MKNEEFLEQFKNEEEFINFLKQIQKQGIEEIFKGESDAPLGYAKHDKCKSFNCSQRI